MQESIVFCSACTMSSQRKFTFAISSLDEFLVKFNPLKSQLIAFGSHNPSSCVISLNGNAISWVINVKYCGL